MQCNNFWLNNLKIVVKKRFLYSNVYINIYNKYKKACIIGVMIWNTQIVSEKVFCHSQISMISIHNILVTF